MGYRKAFRFQLRPRSGREGRLRRYAGMCRRVWNDALAEQKARHARGERYASYLEMASWLTAWRHAPATAWLSEGPVHPQQQVLLRLDEASSRFFAKEGGYPRFKRRGDDPGLRFPDPKQFALDQVNARIKLPKLGWLRLRMSRPVEGALRNVMLRREGQQWFASIQVEMSETVPLLEVPPTLGIDRGLSTFAATSDERLVPPLKALAKQQRRLRYLQRAVSRKRKGSSNRGKAVPHLPHLPLRVGRESQDSGALSVRGLRPRGACRHSRREEHSYRGTRGLGKAADRSARSPWRGVKTGEHRSFCEVGTRRSKGIGMSYAHVNARWIDFPDRGAHARKGSIGINQAIAALIRQERA
jgi:Helix-turn-helix domain